MRYRCVKTHYDPADRALPRKERKVIKVGDEQEFAVQPERAAWQRIDDKAKPATKK